MMDELEAFSKLAFSGYVIRFYSHVAAQFSLPWLLQSFVTIDHSQYITVGFH